MRIFENHYNDIHPGYPIENISPLEKILFIDIETTGLSRTASDLYLIGCGYFDRAGYHTTQWFADSNKDEPQLIKEFTAFINDRFIVLIHYNGNHFDIPYLRAKAQAYELGDPFGGLDNYDIYALIKPYKKLLGLQSLRQRSVEELLGLSSDDPYTGRELISVYKEYTHYRDEKLLEPLIYHNSEDLKGMAYILPILCYTEVVNLKLNYLSHSVHEYKDFSDVIRQELLISYSHDLNIPKSFIYRDNDIILTVKSDKSALLRLPVFNMTLKRFYPDPKNYYYLPAEDCCVHKSVASAVPKERRESAKKETCYTKYSGLFIPSILPGRKDLFRESYLSKTSFLPFDEISPDLFTEIGEKLIGHIIQ